MMQRRGTNADTEEGQNDADILDRLIERYRGWIE
jgi:hypothetical protein